MSENKLKSIITCPKCDYKKTEVIPVDAANIFMNANHARKYLKPLKGDCCVFCSYGSNKCPPIQRCDSGCDRVENN